MTSKTLLALLLFCPAPAEAAPKPYTPFEIEKLAPQKCLEMAEVPAGEFLFGDNFTYKGKRRAVADPVRREKTPGFLIDKCKVTRKQYIAWYTSAVDPGRKFSPMTKEQYDSPVTNITQLEAEAYCKFMGKRLPSEKEWEKAARGGTESVYWWGDDWPGARNDYEQHFEEFKNQHWYYPVARKAANPYGLYDMLGNVREMTSGDWDKGGSIRLNYTSCGGRYRKSRDGRAGDLGWRCVRDLAASPQAGQAPAGKSAAGSRGLKRVRQGMNSRAER